MPLLALSVLQHRCNCRNCRCYNFASSLRCATLCWWSGRQRNPPSVLHVTRPPSESEFCCTCFVATSPKTACRVPKSVTPLHDIVASGKVPGHTGWMGASFHLLFAAKSGNE